MVGRLIFCGLMLGWLVALPIFYLVIGMGGFEALSPLGLLGDLAAMPGSWSVLLGRLLIWAYLLFPVLGYFALVRDRSPR